MRRRDGSIVQLPRAKKSNILNMIGNRQSVRQFQDGQISGSKLSGLFEAAYDIGQSGHWSVPSVGAMYPLDVYMIIPGDNQILDACSFVIIIFPKRDYRLLQKLVLIF